MSSWLTKINISSAVTKDCSSLIINMPYECKVSLKMQITPYTENGGSKNVRLLGKFVAFVLFKKVVNAFIAASKIVVLQVAV